MSATLENVAHNAKSNKEFAAATDSVHCYELKGVKMVRQKMIKIIRSKEAGQTNMTVKIQAK
jgi:hypothetical protein